ncbi:unnamed protein product [Ambrosiozyma monospora]|uniref:Unnamed protein product n=1 Tax=Ambrosiozyma monospora TaxID=43982 RepID=A0ACB5TN74_AMBMO|nr:unnamed protein product [Ambrosiozyma monospora]
MTLLQSLKVKQLVYDKKTNKLQPNKGAATTATKNARFFRQLFVPDLKPKADSGVELIVLCNIPETINLSESLAQIPIILQVNCPVNDISEYKLMGDKALNAAGLRTDKNEKPHRIPIVSTKLGYFVIKRIDIKLLNHTSVQVDPLLAAVIALHL